MKTFARTLFFQTPDDNAGSGSAPAKELLPGAEVNPGPGKKVTGFNGETQEAQAADATEATTQDGDAPAEGGADGDAASPADGDAPKTD